MLENALEESWEIGLKSSIGMIEQRHVHVVDDEESVRRSLDFVLRMAGFCVDQWCDGETFLDGVDKSKPACVLLDIRLTGMDGLQVQLEMPARGLNFPVIVLTGHGDLRTAVRAMQGGAVDFLEKPFDRSELLDALDSAFELVSDRQRGHDLKRRACLRAGVLSTREREVLDGLACGLPNKTVAYDLGVSLRTIEVHRSNLMTKLGVSNFPDALRIAFAAGLGSKADWDRRHRAGSSRRGT